MSLPFQTSPAITLETSGYDDDDDEIRPPTRRNSNGVLQTTFWYRLSSIDDLELYPLRTPNGTPIDTTINIHVMGNVRGLEVRKGVTANIYFTGNMSGKADEYPNLNADGPLPAWDFYYTSLISRTAATGFTASDVGKLAYQEGTPGHLLASGQSRRSIPSAAGDMGERSSARSRKRCRHADCSNVGV